MKTSKEKLKALDDKEALKRRTAKAKNDLEAYIYKIADTNSDEIYQLVTNSTQREPLEVLSHEVLSNILI